MVDMVIFVCLAMCYTYVDHDQAYNDSYPSMGQLQSTMSANTPRMPPFNVSSTVLVPMSSTPPEEQLAGAGGKLRYQPSKINIHKNSLPSKRKFLRRK